MGRSTISGNLSPWREPPPLSRPMTGGWPTPRGRRSALILPQPRKNFLGMEYPGLIILAGEYPEGPELTGSLQGEFFSP